MSKTHSIPIANKVDIHAARMYTRQVAREIGMDLITQARVSLVTSSLATILEMGSERGVHDTIQIDEVRSQDLCGVKVTFITRKQKTRKALEEEMKDLHVSGDELSYEETAGQLHVTLMMWSNGQQ